MKRLVLFADFLEEAAATLSLLSNSKQYRIDAIVSCTGHVAADDSYKNACVTAAKLKKEYKILKGADQSMVADIDPMRKLWDPEAVPEAQRENGLLDGAENIDQDGQEAVIWLIEYLKSVDEPVTVLALGPLTDLALVLRICPSCVKKIEKTVICGGTHKFGDVTAAAEYNIWYDPEAAAIVMGCETDKIIIPSDCANNLIRTEEGLNTYNNIESLINKDIIFRKTGRDSAYDGISFKTRLLSRLLAAAALEDEDVLNNLIPYSVDVDCSDTYADGQTVFDTRRIFDDYNCRTAFTCNADKLLSTLQNLAK